MYWMGEVPSHCETCSAEPLDKVFYDAKTSMGPWGCICNTCFTFGPGLNRLGTGWGQKYEKQKDGKWLKVAG